jgi:predicted ATP-binding protein involved in virulence
MMLNPHLYETAIQKTAGVVLIDEIDLHLHPRWQQQVLGDLMKIFPQIQFIITTHAPSVIQSVKHENLLILADDTCYYPSQNVYGRDVNSILANIMGAKSRPATIEERFDEIYKHIDAGELELASAKTDELEQIIGEDDPDICKIRVTIDLESLGDET